ncbi:2-succinyl-5-enolpyruvyl-6-hydroxy-3-cyclohexene-1-carboxylic-acid synthase [Candidatus Chloroploca sp. Khr17]|uniref:2-succinyl-5-enolpyruvyl-6-hydroxy-3- cyclohexene-1-carboxylic-acid synthase n=1 Tax=Candidatus Chloroploca sp. Khr17 TaxID=2496869 RepID=UPI00101D1105|nr:2-succinyl-5-enolpyruvyl-6-hydroxy-3-cyclohexene-1-carboxylic-acid synthase [Candidatus Chloroploca sp. Khr17]
MTTHDHIRALTLWVGTLIDELIAGGVRDIVICPGSRSTPLALAAARHPQAQIWMHLDERSAGFFALGLARQRGQPAALLCTSGTAAANFLPAVAEADLARVPLIVLTADRPPELRDNGAPQTIDQVRLFGSRTRWATDLPTPDASPGLRRYLQSTVARSIATSLAAPAGPVHLNLPFREPLVPDRELLADLFAGQATGSGAPLGPAQAAFLPPRFFPEDAAGSAEQPSRWATVQARVGARQLDEATVTTLASRLATTERGLILCGPECAPGLAPVVTRLAARLGYPVLADPLSGVRCGRHDRTMVLAGYDAFVRDEAFAARFAPELVLRFGAMPTAKPVLQFLQRHATAHQIVIDEGAGWREPTSLAATHLACDSVTLCQTLTERLGHEATDAAATQPWAAAWRSAEAVTQRVLGEALRQRAAINEPGIFAALAELLPDGATLFVGNSMPVRDCDTFFPAVEREIAILGNRGANGIDGLVSTALGMAAAGAKPLVLVLGDISLYHDANGLLAAKLHQLDATIILINNDGGGIFSFLPQTSETDRFELLFGTPHGLNFAPLAAIYGAQYTLAEDWEGFRRAVRTGISGRGLHLIEVRTDRNQNVADHRVLWPEVGAALEEVGF